MSSTHVYVQESRPYAKSEHGRLRQIFAYFLSATNVKNLEENEETKCGCPASGRLCCLERCDHQAYVCYIFILRHTSSATDASTLSSK